RGVVLTVPEGEGVSREGQSLRLTVRATPGRRLLVAASSRGRLVDQQYVDAGPSGAEVRLSPVAGARGVVRLTAYEATDNQLVPLAERLVYREPAEYLRLSALTGNKKDPRSFRPGDSVELTLQAVDEHRRPAKTWFTAAVVDERSLRSAEAQ